MGRNLKTDTIQEEKSDKLSENKSIAKDLIDAKPKEHTEALKLDESVSQSENLENTKNQTSEINKNKSEEQVTEKSDLETSKREKLEVTFSTENDSQTKAD